MSKHNFVTDMKTANGEATKEDQLDKTEWKMVGRLLWTYLQALQLVEVGTFSVTGTNIFNRVIEDTTTFNSRDN